jgi:hypothetical protein
MADLKLAGMLNLAGALVLDASGGKVSAGGAEVLVESSAPAGPHHGTGAPVILPPPPPALTDPGPNVWVVSSFYKFITVNAATGSKPVVALGMVMQGNVPMWPGMVMQGPSTVTVNRVPVNVKGDQALIFPTGAPVGLSVGSGQ